MIEIERNEEWDEWSFDAVAVLWDELLFFVVYPQKKWCIVFVTVIWMLSVSDSFSFGSSRYRVLSKGFKEDDDPQN